MMSAADLPQPADRPLPRPAGVPESIRATLERVARFAGPDLERPERIPLYWRILSGGNVGWPPAVTP